MHQTGGQLGRLQRARSLPTHTRTPSTRPTLHPSYLAELEHGAFSVHHGMIQKAPGSGPNDPGSFQLVDHVVLPTRPPAPSR